MRKWTITRIWMEHTGGTKFYQLFHIRVDGATLGVGMTHWGRLTSDAPFARPLLGGQTQVIPAATVFDKWRAKEARGYREIDRQDLTINGDLALVDWLRASCGSSHAHPVMAALGLSEVAFAREALAPEPAPEPEPELVLDRGEAWGSW